MHSMRELFHLSLIFFYGGEHLSESFKQACNFLLLSDEKVAFVDILFSDRDQNIMTNSLSTQVESGSILYQKFQNEFHIATALKNMSIVICLRFLLMMLKKTTSFQTKTVNTCFINLTAGENLWKEKNFLYVTLQKQKMILA